MTVALMNINNPVTDLQFKESLKRPPAFIQRRIPTAEEIRQKEEAEEKAFNQKVYAISFVTVTYTLIAILARNTDIFKRSGPLKETRKKFQIIGDYIADKAKKTGIYLYELIM